MRIVVTWVLIALSASTAITLVFSVVGVLRRRPTPWKWAAMVALMMMALWCLHALTPAATTPLLYLCVPAALVGALLILLCGSKGPTFGAPHPGPDCHAPAMAKRPASETEDADGCEVVDGRKRIA